MKKLFLAALIFVLCMGLANAAPFLVCDSDPLATSYLIVLDSGEEIETPVPLHYDLVGIETGYHVIEVRAKNVWGVSSSVPFEFTKELPQSPTGMGLSSD